MVLRPRPFAATAVVSLLTMPLTAVWFLLLGWLLMAGSAVAAATCRQPDEQAVTLGAGVSIAAGLLAGPAVYLLLALATT